MSPFPSAEAMPGLTHAAERVTLGRSGPAVSRLAFGCEPLGGVDWGVVDTAEICAAVGEALDHGIDFFDTADVYGLGRSEERLAQALGARRHDVVIATKGGVAWRAVRGGRAETWFDGSAKWLRTAVEGSLRRLRLDTIPLYYLHWPDPAMPVEASLDALRALSDAGMIGHIGCSNFDAAQLRAACAVAPVAAVQVHYNMLERSVEDGLIDVAREHGVGVAAYGPLAQGLLTGGYGRGARFGTDDRRSRLPHFAADALERGLRTVERVRRVAADRGATPAQVAIRWVLDRPGISAAIVGIKNRRQLADNVGALSVSLTPAELYYLTNDEETRG
jgi:aryl-alcohol dehydrogenase-like predicted oxidoreductase